MVSIIYFSKNGNTKALADIVANGAKSVNDTEVRVFSIDDIDYDYVSNSNTVIFGTPTYYANTCWQMKKWFDTSSSCKLEGKIGGVFVTADYMQGGGDVAALTIIQHMMVKGMLVYSGGTALGKPYLHLGPVAIKGNDELNETMCEVYGQRIAQKAEEIFADK